MQDIQEMQVRSLDREDPGSLDPWIHGRGHDNPLQYSCLENPMGRGAWQATIHRVAQSQTQLKQLSTQHTHNFKIQFYQVYFICVWIS